MKTKSTIINQIPDIYYKCPNAS